MTKTTKIVIAVVLLGAAGGAAYWYFTRDETMELIKKAYTNLTDAEKTTLQKKVATLTDAERKIANTILKQIIANEKELLAKMTVEAQTIMEIKIGLSMKNYFPMTAAELAIQPN